jgi:hypothetical protein
MPPTHRVGFQIPRRPRPQLFETVPSKARTFYWLPVRWDSIAGRCPDSTKKESIANSSLAVRSARTSSAISAMARTRPCSRDSRVYRSKMPAQSCEAHPNLQRARAADVNALVVLSVQETNDDVRGGRPWQCNDHREAVSGIKGCARDEDRRNFGCRHRWGVWIGQSDSGKAVVARCKSRDRRSAHVGRCGGCQRARCVVSFRAGRRDQRAADAVGVRRYTGVRAGARSAASERSRQAEQMLGHIREDQVRRNGRNLVQARFAEFALDVVFIGKAESAVRLQAHVGSLP